MPSENNNRYYRLNASGHLAFAEWLEAVSDEDAIAQIATKYPSERSEVWQGTRLVTRLTPRHFNADDPDLQNAVGERLSVAARELRLGLKS
jgi:hypothetical protein